MKKFVSLFVAAVAAFSCFTVEAGKLDPSHPEYVVFISNAARNSQDTKWREAASELGKRHNAPMAWFENSPRELMSHLREYGSVRYVAIVELPERLNRDYIMDLHRMSREVDDDIYADFMWGIISGYDGASALKMVQNSAEPLTVKNAVATIMETESAVWFDRYAWVDDHVKGRFGYKNGKEEQVIVGTVPAEEVLPKFTELYKEYDPDLVITAAHATEHNLEMPFSLGNWKERDGKLYAEDRFTGKTWDVPQSGKRKVYFAVGNCLIGNFAGTPHSMAAAWINSADAATMSGYVVTTWHGRNGWGGLKYWLTNAGHQTMAESIYLNQQDMLHQLEGWSPSLLTAAFPYSDYFMKQINDAAAVVGQAIGTKPTMDQIGFWHDRDVLAYYGDPRWAVNLQEATPRGYTVSLAVHGSRATVTIKTAKDFSMARLNGGGFKQEHVLDLPLSFWFPRRLHGVRLAPGQPWDTALSDDFILVYDELKPNKTYKIELELEARS